MVRVEVGRLCLTGPCSPCPAGEHPWQDEATGLGTCVVAGRGDAGPVTTCTAALTLYEEKLICTELDIRTVAGGGKPKKCRRGRIWSKNVSKCVKTF